MDYGTDNSNLKIDENEGTITYRPRLRRLYWRVVDYNFLFTENSIQLILRKVWVIQNRPSLLCLTFLFSPECINTGTTFNTATFADTLQKQIQCSNEHKQTADVEGCINTGIATIWLRLVQWRQSSMLVAPRPSSMSHSPVSSGATRTSCLATTSQGRMSAGWLRVSWTSLTKRTARRRMTTGETGGGERETPSQDHRVTNVMWRTELTWGCWTTTPSQRLRPPSWTVSASGVCSGEEQQNLLCWLFIAGQGS